MQFAPHGNITSDSRDVMLINEARKLTVSLINGFELRRALYRPDVENNNAERTDFRAL